MLCGPGMWVKLEVQIRCPVLLRRFDCREFTLPINSGGKVTINTPIYASRKLQRTALVYRSDIGVIRIAWIGQHERLSPALPSGRR
jgi:hypothetical protein